MSIQLLNGLILLNGGSVAVDSACCCDDPCIECNPCPTCWNSLSDPCAELDSVDFTIAGATNGTRSDCSCSSINATYTLDIETNLCNYQGWSPISGCVVQVPRLSPFYRLVYSVEVKAAWQFLQEDKVISNQSDLDAAGLPFSGRAKFCNAMTLYAGHYVRVIVSQVVIFPSPFFVASFDQHYFYSFNNDAIKPGCPDDQVYGLCSGLGSGGTATHLFSTQGGLGPVMPTSCYYDFGFPELCDLDSLTVTIGTPVIIVTPPPPPPP